MFYYNCGDQFIIDIATQYITCYDGNIVFANGDSCLIYVYRNGVFNLFKNITANLQKRQKKGGQSALRISRLAEETRHMYTKKIIDNLNKLNRDSETLLFGSKEITGMILQNKTLLQPVKNKGFLEFNIKTIIDTRKWCKYFNENDDDEYNNYYENILLYLDISVDRLDFDINNKNEMEYYLCRHQQEDSIPFPKKENKYYDKLCGFEYIGIKYYSYETNNIED